MSENTPGTDAKFQIETAVDPTGAVGGFAQVKQAGADAARSVSDSAAQASKSVAGIGDAAGKSATQSEKATSNLIASIQRATAAAQAGQKGTAAYFEQLASQRGANLDVLRPYIQGLSDAEKAQEAARSGLGRMELTAKQTAAAMRQVPAQFTDIVVSLSSGQSPMTVLLQQGGQLKDVFGGVGEAAKAMGTYIAGLATPFTVVTAAVAAVAYSAYQGKQELSEYSRVLTLTGNISGTTAGQLSEMARAVSDVSGTQSNAAGVLVKLAESGQVARSAMRDVAASIVSLERAGGPAADELVKSFASLGKDPVQAALKLNEQYGFLTASVYKQIQALAEQGRTAEATDVAQKAFADALLQRAPEMEKGLGLVEKGWRGIKDAIASARDALMDIGRVPTTEGDLASVTAKIASISKQIELRGSYDTSTQYGRDTIALGEELRLLKERQSILQSEVRLGRTIADNQADQKNNIALLDNWNKADEQFLSKKARMAKEVADATSQGQKLVVAGLLEQSALEQRIAAIKEKYADKTKKSDYIDGRDAAKDWAGWIDKFNDAIDESEGKLDGLTKSQVNLVKYLKSSYATETDAQRAEVLAKAYQSIANEQNAAAIKAQAKAMDEARKAAAATAESLNRVALADDKVIRLANSYIDAVDEQVKLTQLEASLMGESAVQREVALKQYRIELELQKQILAIKNEMASDKYQADAIARVTAAADKAKANAAAEVVNNEFKRVSQQIETSLTDALMRGFESGKSFAANLRDTVVNMFKTLVLRPVIQAVVNPVAMGITGALGFAGPANAASGLGGLANAGSSLFGSGSTIWSQFATSGMGNALGLSTTVDAIGGIGTAANALTGAGQAFTSAMPYIGAGLAVLSLLKSLDDSGTMHTGGLGAYSAAGGASTGNAVKSANAGFFNLNPNDYQASTEQASVAMAKSIVGMLDATASTFGQSAGYYAATAFADDASKDGAWGSLLIKLGDKVLADWGPGGPNYLGKEFADGQAGATQYAAAVAKDVRDYLITQTPDWADAMLTALGDAPTLDQLGAVVAQINAAATAMDTMGDASASWAAMTDATTTAIIKALGGAEAAVASMGSYYSNFYTDAERTAVTTQQLTDALGKLGIALPTTRDAYRALVDAALAAGDADLAAKLIGLSDAFASITSATTSSTEALQKAAADLQSSAMAQLQYSINRDKAQLQASADAAASLRDEVQTVFDALTGPIAELRAQAMGTAGSAAQGQAYINQALAAARGTGALPDATALADAIGAVRNGITGGQYGSSVDQQFAAAKLAGELSVLQAVAGDQLTEAERQYQAAQKQIEALDRANAYWQDQLELSQSGIDATMSVADAVTALQEALKPGSTGKGKTSADSGSSGSRGYYAPSGERVDLIEGVGGTAAQIYGAKVASAIDNARNNGNTLAAAEIWLNSATGRGLGSSDAAAKAAIEAGATADEIKRLEDIGKAYQAIQDATGHNPTAAQLEEELRRRNIPAFASGGWHSGGWAMVGENGPELAYMPPAQIYTANQTSAMLGGLGNTARLESLVSQLLERIASLEATAAQGAAAQQAAADTLAAVTQGNALVTQAAPTF